MDSCIESGDAVEMMYLYVALLFHGDMDIPQFCNEVINIYQPVGVCLVFTLAKNENKELSFFNR